MLENTKRQDIIEHVAKQMSKKRFEHVLRVEQKAIELARQYHVDVASCQLAALLHDLAKEWSDQDYEKAVELYQLPKCMLAYGSNILHGPVAACYAKDTYDIDEHIFQAIYYHTIGHKEMSDVAKVLYIADYIEMGRHFTGVEHARDLANISLDATIKYRLQQTIIHLVTKGKVIFPDMIETYNHWFSQE